LQANLSGDDGQGVTTFIGLDDHFQLFPNKGTVTTRNTLPLQRLGDGFPADLVASSQFVDIGSCQVVSDDARCLRWSELPGLPGRPRLSPRTSGRGDRQNSFKAFSLFSEVPVTL
jgi:hypothetical protein